jgi:prepilin-type N-terminal cleavage/methylation domain-containing protein
MRRLGRAPARSPRPTGFTLMEVLVVLIILTLIAGATVPAIMGERRPDDDLTTAARQVEQLFRLARDSAIRSGGAVTVMMDSATSLVWMLTEAAPPTAESDETEGPTALPGLGAPTSAGTALELPPSVRVLLGTTRARFTFLPTGATLADSLVLSHMGASLVLTLDPWTGDVVAR